MCPPATVGSKFDHVQTLCCLASYYGMLAQEARDLKEVSDHSTRANGLIFDARNLDLGEQLPHLVAGQLALAKRDLRAARAEFKRAQELTCNGRKTIAGRLALANLAYREQDFAEAARECVPERGEGWKVEGWMEEGAFVTTGRR